MLTRTDLASVTALVLVICCGQTRAQDVSKPTKIEIGVHFTTLTLGPSVSSGIRVGFAALRSSHFEPGIGGRVTFNVNRHLALESEGNLFPGRLTPNTLQLQAGAKAGRRFKRIGIFARARPGLVSFSNLVTEEGTESVGLPPLQFTVPRFVTRRRSFFSMDVGGVAEFYLSRRILARVDGGDTIIRYGKGLFYDTDENTPQSPGQTKHNFQLSIGVGFRF